MRARTPAPGEPGRQSAGGCAEQWQAVDQRRVHGSSEAFMREVQVYEQYGVILEVYDTLSLW